MEESKYDAQLSEINTSLETDNYQQALHLANDLEPQLATDDEFLPMSRGWLVFFKFKALYLLDDYEQALAFFEEHRYACLAPNALGLRPTADNIPEVEHAIAFGAQNMGWMNSVAAECAARCDQPRKVVQYANQAIKMRQIGDDVSSMLQAANTAIVLLAQIERDDLNGEFAYLFLNLSKRVDAVPGVVSATLALWANFKRSSQEHILRSILLTLDQYEQHPEAGVTLRELRQEISEAGLTAELPTEVSNDDLVTTINAMGTYATELFAGGCYRQAYGVFSDIIDLQIHHGQIYFDFLCRAFSAQFASLVADGQVENAIRFWQTFEEKIEAEDGIAQLIQLGLRNGVMHGLENDQMIFLITRGYKYIHWLEEQEDKKSAVDSVITKIYASDSYNDESNPYIAKHWRNLYHQITSGNVPEEWEAEIASHFDGQTTQEPSDPFPPMDPWQSAHLEPDAVISTKSAGKQETTNGRKQGLLGKLKSFLG